MIWEGLRQWVAWKRIRRWRRYWMGPWGQFGALRTISIEMPLTILLLIVNSRALCNKFISKFNLLFVVTLVMFKKKNEKKIKFLICCLDRKIKNLVIHETKFPQKSLKCPDREIKLPRKLATFATREIKFPRKKSFKPTAKLNSRENFFP